MDIPTFLEVEAERDTVASVLDAVPGVAVVDDAAVPSPRPDGADDPGPGLTDRLKSLWRQWGLLGTGLSLIALGAATVGLWWYRRRNADGADAASTDEDASEWATERPDETPPPTEPSGDTPSPAETEFEPTAVAEDVDETPTPEAQETALASELPQAEPESRQQETGGDTELSVAPETDSLERAETEPTETGTDERPAAKIDPAPLLGAAFLILSSALGRWATRDRSEQA